MKSVRIEPIFLNGETEVLVSIVCNCGGNELENVANGERDSKHRIRISRGQMDVILKCRCDQHYIIHPQLGHIHIITLKK